MVGRFMSDEPITNRAVGRFDGDAMRCRALPGPCATSPRGRAGSPGHWRAQQRHVLYSRNPHLDDDGDGGGGVPRQRLVRHHAGRRCRGWEGSRERGCKLDQMPRFHHIAGLRMQTPSCIRSNRVTVATQSTSRTNIRQPGGPGPVAGEHFSMPLSSTPPPTPTPLSSPPGGVATIFSARFATNHAMLFKVCMLSV